MIRDFTDRQYIESELCFGRALLAFEEAHRRLGMSKYDDGMLALTERSVQFFQAALDALDALPHVARLPDGPVLVRAFFDDRMQEVWERGRIAEAKASIAAARVEGE